MATPVVQIVHYSDLHIVGPDYMAQRRSFEALLKRLPGMLKQGVAGASLAALSAFEDFVRDIASDATWRDKPIWLVDTGDGTTFGDDRSLDAWLNDWSPKFLAAAGANGKQLVLYGNHDAWPGTFPLLAPRSMEAHRDKLRSARFPQTWPTQPLTTLLAGSAGPEVQLYALNSVDHTLWANTMARGAVLPDRHWQKQGTMPGPRASDDLDLTASASAGTSATSHFRILAMHYPVAAACNAGQKHLEILANRDPFAKDIDGPRHASKPLVHVLMAGHTHSAFPPLGLLPNGLGSARHPPLGGALVQMVTPSLSQTPVSAFSSATPSYYPDACAQSFPYQCTLLRVFATPISGGGVEVTVQRFSVGRPSGGAFGYLPVAEGSSRHHEELQLVL